MFASRSNTSDLSHRVASLPDDYLVRRLGAHFAVVGPTGAFLVGRCGDDPAASASATCVLAHELRRELSEVVAWTPFVDPLVVAERDISGLDCVVIDIAMLEPALTHGATNLDETSLQQLRHHLPSVVMAMELSGPDHRGQLPAIS